MHLQGIGAEGPRHDSTQVVGAWHYADHKKMRRQSRAALGAVYSAARRMRLVFALPTTSLLLLWSAALRAQAAGDEAIAPTLSVTREAGAESCPDTAALLAHVERVRGQPATGASSAYHVSFSYRGGVFSARIRVGEASGARVLRDRGSTCASLEQATAVTLALLLDSDTRAPAPEPEPELPPLPAPARDIAPRPVEPSRTAVSLTFSLGGGGLSGVLQPVAPVVVGELGIGIERFRTNIGALWMPPQTLDFGPGTLDESLLSGAARTCLSALRGHNLRLDVCSGFYVGRLKVEARGYTVNKTATKTWLALPVGLALATTSSPLGVELGASALVPLRRDDFSIDHLGVAYRSWPVGMLLSIRAVGSWLL